MNLAEESRRLRQDYYWPSMSLGGNGPAAVSDALGVVLVVKKWSDEGVEYEIQRLGEPWPRITLGTPVSPWIAQALLTVVGLADPD